MMWTDHPPYDAPGAAPAHDPPRPEATKAPTLPDLVLTVYGTPAPQGSKTPRPIYRGKRGERQFTGKVALVEDYGQRLTFWRDAIVGAAAEAMIGRAPLDGFLRLQVVLSVGPKPTRAPGWWPQGEPFSRRLWFEPAGPPDLDKYIRAVGDSLKLGGAITDDARFTKLRDSAKVYCGDPDEPDALDRAGAVIRVWRVGVRQT